MTQEKKTSGSTERNRKPKTAAKAAETNRTEVIWEGQGCNRDLAEEQVKAFTEENAADLPDGKDSGHLKEQLYLFFREGLSKEFLISAFLNDQDIDEVSLDILRFLALMGGEEFASEFLKQKFTLSQAREKLADLIVKEELPLFDEVKKLILETEKLRECFDTQMMLLEKEQNSAKKYADELIRREREIAADQQEMLTKKCDAEKAQLKAEIERINDALQSERAQFTDKMDEAKREYSILQEELEHEREEKKKQLKASDQNSQRNMDEEETKFSTKVSSSFSYKGMPGKRAERRRREYIATVLANSRYSEEQLSVICDAVEKGLSQHALMQMCNPDLSVINMRLLEVFFLKTELNMDLDEGVK